MTVTDYNAIVEELNRPTATVKPKGNPDRTHIAGLNQTRLKMRTDDAHLWPAKRYVENAIIESDKDRKRFINRMDRIRAKKWKSDGVD